MNFPHFDEHDGRFKNADNSDYNYSAEYDQDYEVRITPPMRHEDVAC